MPAPRSPIPVSAADIRAARARIAPYIRTTPVLSLTADVALKLENLQITGSFKVRGAFNHVLALRAQCEAGIITASSGNHGQAVAFVAKVLGLKAAVVVPDDVAASKAAGISGYGAELIRHGRYSEERVTYAKELASRRGLHYVPPYDDAWVIAGQGTAGLEILEQVPDVAVVAVPVSGGGLISGIAMAVKDSRPQAKVVGVEPQEARRFALSRSSGTPITLAHAQTIADGLRVLTPGRLTWEITNRDVDEFAAVDDDAILAAMRRLAFDGHVVAEPSGAASAAYALAAGAAHTVAVVSGGNVDPAVLLRALAIGSH